MSSLSTLTFMVGGLLRRGDGRPCLARRPHYNDWSFPKGKLEPSETLVETTVGEAREGTRCEVDCGQFAECYKYRIPGDAGIWSGPKGVLVWHIRVVDEHQLEPDAEADARRQVTLAETLKRLTYGTERALVRRAFELNE